jgi:hypothetical protein
MQTYCESGRIAPRILNLGTRWRWVVKFTPPAAKILCVHRIGGGVGPRARLDTVARRRNPSHFREWYSGHAARSLVTITDWATAAHNWIICYYFSLNLLGANSARMKCGYYTMILDEFRDWHRGNVGRRAREMLLYGATATLSLMHHFNNTQRVTLVYIFCLSQNKFGRVSWRVHKSLWVRFLSWGRAFFDNCIHLSSSCPWTVTFLCIKFGSSN